MKKPTRDTLSFGGGLIYYSIDHYAAVLEKPRRSIINMMRALNVPIIHWDGNKYVQHTQFIVAMSAVGRIGRPDFFFPGQAKGKKNPDVAYSLDWTELKNEEAYIVSGLIYALRIRNREKTSETLKAEAVRTFRQLVESLESPNAQLVKDGQTPAGADSADIHPRVALAEYDERAHTYSNRTGAVD